MSDAAKKKAHIVSSFTDAGTGEQFTAGETPLIDAGRFGNFEAAGLVRPATAQVRASAPAKAKPKAPRRKPTPTTGSIPSPKAAAPVPAPESPAPSA